MWMLVYKWYNNDIARRQSIKQTYFRESFENVWRVSLKDIILDNIVNVAQEIMPSVGEPYSEIN